MPWCNEVVIVLLPSSRDTPIHSEYISNVFWRWFISVLLLSYWPRFFTVVLLSPENGNCFWATQKTTKDSLKAYKEHKTTKNSRRWEEDLKKKLTQIAAPLEVVLLACKKGCNAQVVYLAWLEYLYCNKVIQKNPVLLVLANYSSLICPTFA